MAPDKPAASVRQPKRLTRAETAARPLAYLLVDLLESDGLGPDEEQAILTFVRWLKRSTKTPRETTPQPTPA